MRNGDNARHAAFMLAIIVVFIAIIIAINRVVNSFREKVRAKEERVKTTEVRTTTAVDYNYEEEDNSPIIVTNFSVSLRDIDPSGMLNGTTNRTIKYSGAVFKYHCSNVVEDVCTTGSITMNVGTSLLPLYVYESEIDNYILRSEDYHIIVSDDYIILTTMGLNNFIGETRIYTRNGEYLKTISDITTKYNYDGGLITTAYPKLIDHTLKYESCKNTLVYDSVKNLLDDKGDSAQVVSGANCK